MAKPILDIKNISEEDLDRLIQQYTAKLTRLASPGQWDPKDSTIPPHLRMQQEIQRISREGVPKGSREQVAKESLINQRAMEVATSPFAAFDQMALTRFKQEQGQPENIPWSQRLSNILEAGKAASIPFINLARPLEEEPEGTTTVSEVLGVQNPYGKAVTDLALLPSNFLPLGAIGSLAKQGVTTLRRAKNTGQVFRNVSNEAKAIAMAAKKTEALIAKNAEGAAKGAEEVVEAGIDPRKLYMSELRGRGLSTPTTPKGAEPLKSVEKVAGAGKTPKTEAEQLAERWGIDEWIKERRDKIVDAKVEAMNNKSSARQRAEEIFKKSKEKLSEERGSLSNKPIDKPMTLEESAQAILGPMKNITGETVEMGGKRHQVIGLDPQVKKAWLAELDEFGKPTQKVVVANMGDFTRPKTLPEMGKQASKKGQQMWGEIEGPHPQGVFGEDTVGAARVGKGGIKTEYEISKPNIGSRLAAKKNRPGATEAHHVLPLSEGADSITALMDRVDYYGKRLPELAADPYYQQSVKEIPVKAHGLIHNTGTFGKGSIGAAQVGKKGIKKDYEILRPSDDVFKPLEDDMKRVGDWGNRWSTKRGWVRGYLDQDILEQRRAYHKGKAQLANLNRYFKDVGDTPRATKAQTLAEGLYKIDPNDIGKPEAARMEEIFEYIHELQRQKMEDTIKTLEKHGVPVAKVDKKIDDIIDALEKTDPETAEWFVGYFKNRNLRPRPEKGKKVPKGIAVGAGIPIGGYLPEQFDTSRNDQNFIKLNTPESDKENPHINKIVKPGEIFNLLGPDDYIKLCEWRKKQEVQSY